MEEVQGPPLVPRSIWVPGAAWAIGLGLAAGAAALGAGSVNTALAVALPFGVGGALLPRARNAVVLTLVVGVALLVLMADPLRGLGLKPGLFVGAIAFAALALPLGSGVGSYRRHKARVRAVRGADAEPGKPRAAAAAPGTALARRPAAKTVRPSGAAMPRKGR